MLCYFYFCTKALLTPLPTPNFHPPKIPPTLQVILLYSPTPYRGGKVMIYSQPVPKTLYSYFGTKGACTMVSRPVGCWQSGQFVAQTASRLPGHHAAISPTWHRSPIIFLSSSLVTVGSASSQETIPFYGGVGRHDTTLDFECGKTIQYSLFHSGGQMETWTTTFYIHRNMEHAQTGSALITLIINYLANEASLNALISSTMVHANMSACMNSI